MMFTKIKYHILVHNFPDDLLLLLMVDTVVQKCTRMSNLSNKTAGELFLFLCRCFGIEELRMTARLERTSGNHSKIKIFARA